MNIDDRFFQISKIESYTQWIQNCQGHQSCKFNSMNDNQLILKDISRDWYRLFADRLALFTSKFININKIESIIRIIDEWSYCNPLVFLWISTKHDKKKDCRKVSSHFCKSFQW